MALTEKELRELSEDEMLVLLIEEAAEVIHAVCKIQRHGPEGRFLPDDDRNDVAVLLEGLQVKELIRHYCGRRGFHYGTLVEGPETFRRHVAT